VSPEVAAERERCARVIETMIAVSAKSAQDARACTFRYRTGIWPFGHIEHRTIPVYERLALANDHVISMARVALKAITEGMTLRAPKP
jgi:hypothetical protein